MVGMRRVRCFRRVSWFCLLVFFFCVSVFWVSRYVGRWAFVLGECGAIGEVMDAMVEATCLNYIAPRPISISPPINPQQASDVQSTISTSHYPFSKLNFLFQFTNHALPSSNLSETENNSVTFSTSDIDIDADIKQDVSTQSDSEVPPRKTVRIDSSVSVSDARFSSSCLSTTCLTSASLDFILPMIS